MKLKTTLSATIIVTCLATTATAQPFSKSMAECAGLFAIARSHLEVRHVQNDAAIYRLEFGQAKWMNAAVKQAQAEGVDDPDAYVDAAMQAKYTEWQDRGVTAVFSEDFNDWMDYCRAFARDRDINLIPD